MVSKDLKQNYKNILQDIDINHKKYQNDLSRNSNINIIKDIKLIAVSKTRSIQEILILNNLGQVDFAESYLQEAIEKIDKINKINQTQNINKKNNIIWHYIGRIQSNKTKLIAENFSWVHSIDKLNIAEKLNNYYINNSNYINNKLNILIQVNIQKDPNKAGVKPDLNSIATLALDINNLPFLKLRGLMTILKLEDKNNFDNQYNNFKKLTDLLNNLNNHYNLNLDTLSMGMSNDYKAAILAGSNMVRVGTSLFGTKTNN